MSIEFSLMAQKVVKEGSYDPTGKATITNLSEVQIDKDQNRMTLFFKATERKIKAEILTFDLDFRFLNAGNLIEYPEKVKEKYKLRFFLEFCEESEEPLLAVEPNPFSGQVVFKKGFIQRYYNWNTGFCDDRFKVQEKVKPRGDEGEKLRLINYW